MIFNKYFVKVNGVKFFHEAQKLMDLGVDVIGITREKDVNYYRERAVDNSFFEKKHFLEGLQIALYVKQESIHGMSINDLYLGEKKLDFLETIYPENISLELCQYMKNSGIQGIKSIFDVDYDTDSTWIVGDRKGKDCILELDFMGGFEDGWDYFVSQSNKDCLLTLDDLYNIIKLNKVFLSTSFNINNCLSIIKQFPTLYGISFTLSDFDETKTINTITYNELLELLTYLR